MTGEEDKRRMLDVIRDANFPTYSGAKQSLISSGHYNKGIQKALDSFYDKLRLKNGVEISRTKRGQIVVKKKGKFLHYKGYAKFIKKFKEMSKQ